MTMTGKALRAGKRVRKGNVIMLNEVNDHGLKPVARTKRFRRTPRVLGSLLYPPAKASGATRSSSTSSTLCTSEISEGAKPCCHEPVVVVKAPPKNELKSEEALEIICECFGIDPDKDKLAYEIFKEIVEAQRGEHGVRTIEITRKVHVTQAAVVYHMNTFMREGLIVKEGREYRLRGRNLDQTFDELEQDMLRRMRRMREIAKRIDDEFFGF